MFKKKDLAIAVAMALSVSPASLAQTDIPEEAVSAETEAVAVEGASEAAAGSILGVSIPQPSR